MSFSHYYAVGSLRPVIRRLGAEPSTTVDVAIERPLTTYDIGRILESLGKPFASKFKDVVDERPEGYLRVVKGVWADENIPSGERVALTANQIIGASVFDEDERTFVRTEDL